MKNEITQEYIDYIIDQMEADNHEVLSEKFAVLHPADIAEIIVQIPEEYTIKVLSFFSNEKMADILAELEEDERAHVLEALTPKEIADIVLDNMESDDAADLLSELPDDIKDEIIDLLSDKEQAEDIKDLLSYPEDSAGGIMAKEFVKININWTVHECIIELRKQAEEVENIHTVYAVDDNDKLIGIISLKQLILSAPQSKAQEIVKRDIITAKVLAPATEVAQLMEKYDLVVIPVIDTQNKLLGRITIDDVVDIIKEEAERDYQLASGITDDVAFTDSIITLTKARFPWLLVGLIGGITGSKIIGTFGVIEETPLLAYFMPLIAAMGGNVGVQSSAIVVQSIASNTLMGNLWYRLLKELGVGLLNGFLCAGILLLFNLLFFDQILISLTVSLSLFCVIIFAAVFGTWIPLILHKYKIDPALATGPFITTTNDIMGLLMYFSISNIILNM
jgi:magnesium transporter